MKTNSSNSSSPLSKNTRNKVRLKIINPYKKALADNNNNGSLETYNKPTKLPGLSPKTNSVKRTILKINSQNKRIRNSQSPLKENAPNNYLNDSDLNQNDELLSELVLSSKTNSRDSSPNRAKTENGDKETKNDIKELEINEIGEEKINEYGLLKGDREYKFKPIIVESINKEKLYLYSTKISKMFKINNTRLIFKICPLLKMIQLSSEQKNKLFKMGLLHPIVKNKSISVVEAKQAFMIFGHLIIKNGSALKDDYYEDNRYEQIIKKLVNYSNANNNNQLLSKNMQNKNKKQDYVSFTSSINKQIMETRKHNLNSFILEPHTNIMFCKKTALVAKTHISATRVKTVKYENTLYTNDGITSNTNYDGLSLLTQSETNSKHPIALVENQYQDTFPLFNQRFGKEYDKTFLESLTLRKEMALSKNGDLNNTSSCSYNSQNKAVTLNNRLTVKPRIAEDESDKLCKICCSLISSKASIDGIIKLSPVENMKCIKCCQIFHYWCLGIFNTKDADRLIDYKTGYTCKECLLKNENDQLKF